jgi:vancomycin resistance protein YoaR
VRVADDDQQPPDQSETPDADVEEARPPEPEAGVVEESDELDLSDLDEPDPEPEPVPEFLQWPEPEAEPEAAPEPEPKEESPPAWFAAEPPEQDNSDTGETPPRTRRVRWILLGVVLVLGALYLAGFVLTGLRMPANATIGGVDVGGLSPGDAREKVDRALSPHVGEDVVLKHDGKQLTVDPQGAGLTFDLDRSIDDAGGHHSWNPRTMAGLLFGTHEFDPAVEADDAKLADIVTSISTGIDREVVEPQITFPKGQPKARQPEAGLVVRKRDAADAVIHAYLVARRPVPVPTAVVEPKVDADGLKKAMTEIAEPAVSGPVVIRVGKKKVSLPVSAYAPALVVRVIGDRLKPEIDPEKLAKPLTNSTTGIGKKAVDATVTVKNGKAVVVPGKEGVGLQPKEMAVKLVPAITEKGDARSVEIDAKVVDPEFTTADAKKLKIKERVSSFSTYFPYAQYRNINQSRAASLINGTILKPGETFSLNNTVGERTVANGFTTGTVISGGVFREELGGGVSQVATTTYNAAFFAGLDDVEHHPHAFYIDRYPVGREATVYFGSLDLRFRNPTKYGVLIRAHVTKSTPGRRGEMHVEMWSTKVWTIKAGLSAKRNARSPGKQYDDTKRCVPQPAIAGFDVDVYRTFLRGGRTVKRETDTAHYQAADHVICGKKP